MKKYLPKILLLLLVSAAGLRLSAQSGQYGNEWIDYSKTYYKFKVGKSGVCRIYRAALNAAGLPASVAGSNFMLYRDGLEVPVFVSAETMGANDYIEFWATKADGMLDKELYMKPGYQPNDRISLFTDTSAYFLTYDNNSNHLRYAAMPNAIPGTTPAPAAYCLATVGLYPKKVWLGGPSYAGTDNLISPQFDDGEGYIDAAYGVPGGGQPATTLVTPNLVPGVNATLHAGLVMRSYKFAHQVRLVFNNTQLTDSFFSDFAAAKHYDLTIPSNLLSASNEVKYTSVSQGGTSTDYDYYGFSLAELEYPRNFDMAGLDQAMFKLPANGAAQYVEFTNLGNARLYDVTNRKWYNGNTAVSGKTRFYLDPSTVDRQIVLLTDAASSVTSLTPVKSFQFTDWTSRQGDFIIISHPDLMQLSNGRRYVQDYADYRASVAGGSHSVAIADITELYDQFAYGYDIHPLSIKHFLKYAYDNWTRKPQDVFLIGRGIFYYKYQAYRNSRSNPPLPIVPVYGVPGSDIDYVIFGTNYSPKMRIGRLPAFTPAEIGTYLTKVQNAEQIAAPAQVPTVATEIWKKRAIHLVGANDAAIQAQLEPVMRNGAAILADTFAGKLVTTFAKTANVAVSNVNALLVDSLLRGGISQYAFYGHGSPYTFDYSLPDPMVYNNNWRMGSFLGLGCDLAQMFDTVEQRTISSTYTLAPKAGVLTFVASTNTSYTGFDDDYLYAYYRSISVHNYGKPVGNHVNFTYDSLTHYLIRTLPYPNYYSTQLECMVITGDPSTVLPSPVKPDYHISDDGLASIPSNVTTSLDSFQLRVSSFNLGKALHADSIAVKVEHINPAGKSSIVTTYYLRDLFFSDTSYIKVPVDKTADLGLNKFKVTIDAAGRYDEVSEMNNTGSLDVFIFSDNLVPVYPPEFAIVHQQGVTLKASTLNAFRKTGRYLLEIDTTELFNSPLKQSTSITSGGGVVNWKPNIQLRDSTVYYWRSALDSTVAGNIQWTGSSFVYLANGSDGWNQSHYYQYTKDIANGLYLRANRKFYYGAITNKVQIKNMVMCWDGGIASCNSSAANMRTLFNLTRIEQSTYDGVYDALSILAIDSATGRPLTNTPSGSTPPHYTTATYYGYYMHQFDISKSAGRLAAAHYLDSLPAGTYIAVKNGFWHGTSSVGNLINAWKADTAIAGSGKSLYHSLYNLGFTKADSMYKERVFVFWRLKGDNSYPVYQQVTDSLSQFIDVTFNISGSDVAGQYKSTVVGPAKAWKTFKWRTFSTDTLSRNDTTSVKILGIDANGNEIQLYPGLPTPRKMVNDSLDLSYISPKQYPRLRLLWNSKDSISLTSPQLAYWRVMYTPVPEAALNPSVHYVFSDSLSQGQMETFSTAIENLTDQPMDSMLVRYKVIGADGITHQLADRRYRPLLANDTLHASITFDPAPYPGKNMLFIEANPANDQPELYHPNNLGYVPFRVGVDLHNPMLDVTFDGVHILNGDIVSAKPFIKIRLKDENKYLALNDTSLLSLSLRYPSDSLTSTTHRIFFDGVKCRFIPATKTEPANEAYIEYRPDLTEDGTYQLTASGKDKSGNIAGSTFGGSTGTEYKISFEVDGKPSITNVLNYPNPFSTSTAFVFTLTGSQIPSQLKIQILTVTGKVVREITRNELGSLHIGRNITDYKWDGRDQFGQLLGNGVYLYRVVSSLNGQDMDLRADTRDMTRNGGGIDKYFKNGYGKMYIMR